MKTHPQYFISKSRRSSKAGMTIGIDLGDIWSHYCTLVDDTSELMAISQFRKIIWAAGRSTQGVKLLNLEADDKVAPAVVIPLDESKSEPETGTLLQ